MRIAVTGASGFVGGHLVPALRAEGHEVLRLVRRAPAAPDEVGWDPRAGQVDVTRLGRVDAAVHLAGAGIGDRRWTSRRKHELLASRVDGTSTIARVLAAMDPLPQVLVSASAIGFYGDTGTRAADETAPADETFLAGLCQRWEAAASPAVDAGIRVVHARSGLIMARDGGAFARLRLILRTGLGGPLGSGRQYWSWISIDDHIRALLFALNTPELSGPVNLTGPVPVTNAEVMRACARALHRPAVLPMPGFALRIVLGEFASELLLDQRVVPARLLQAGFVFSHPDIDSAARSIA